MEKLNAVSRDATHILQLLEARYGNASPQTRLGTLLGRNSHLDPLDWSLLVISIEIDLRVSMTPSLLDPSRWTVAKFARSVAALPKVTRLTHTIDLLTLLSDAWLRAQTTPDPIVTEASRRPSKKLATNRRAPALPAAKRAKRQR